MINSRADEGSESLIDSVAHDAGRVDGGLARRTRRDQAGAELGRPTLARSARRWHQRHWEMLSSADGERVVRLVAHRVGDEVNVRSPRVSAELLKGGERF